MMNKIIKLIVTGLFIFFLPIGIMAQDPPPPPDSGHGQNGDQDAGGGAPIGSSLLLLLGMGAAYGGKKVYDMKKAEAPE